MIQSEKPTKRRNLKQWQSARLRRLMCERQPTERQRQRMKQLQAVLPD